MRVFASMTHAHLRARHVITSLGTPGADGAVPEDGWRDVVDADDGAGAFRTTGKDSNRPTSRSRRGFAAHDVSLRHERGR